jgi:drug/metabolite transporter (DMT)-like permease
VILYLGVLQIGLAYTFLTGAMKVTPALEASLLLLVEPVFNPLWAWLVQGERPGGWALAGGALIIAATALKAWLDTRSGETPVPPPLD